MTQKMWEGLYALPAFSFIFLEEKMEQIPFWERYTLSIEEAAQYFRIGENKLRKIVNDDRNAPYILWNGSRPQIKRTMFEKYVDKLDAI